MILGGCLAFAFSACGAPKETGVTTSHDASVDAKRGDGRIIEDLHPPDPPRPRGPGCNTVMARDPRAAITFVVDATLEPEAAWSTVRAALPPFVDGQPATDWRFGVIVTGDSLDPLRAVDAGAYPSPVDITPRAASVSLATAFTSRLASAPASGARILDALRGAYRSLVTEDAPRAVILLLGDRTTASGALDRDALLSLVRDAHTRKILTIAIGLNAVDDELLRAIAREGGSAMRRCPAVRTVDGGIDAGDASVELDASRDGDAAAIDCVFHPGGVGTAFTQSLSEVLERARWRVRGCTYPFPPDAAIVNPDLINVFWTGVNGKKHLIEKDDVDGWTYDDEDHPTKVELHGAACEDLMLQSASFQATVCGILPD